MLKIMNNVHFYFKFFMIISGLCSGAYNGAKMALDNTLGIMRK
jgi:hypothetical protein